MPILEGDLKLSMIANFKKEDDWMDERAKNYNLGANIEIFCKNC